MKEVGIYLDNDYKSIILQELYFNAYRTITSVYLFNNFDDYIFQLKSGKQEDKKEIYWNAAYFEKLIDYVKICIAFESYNKAMLIENNILVHKISHEKQFKSHCKLQSTGNPINYSEFLTEYGTKTNLKKEVFLNGLMESFQTINYSDTLNKNYQEIINLDSDLIFRLKEINDKRNRLHFFTDFKGAFEVNSHISKWSNIMNKSIETIKAKYEKAI